MVERNRFHRKGFVAIRIAMCRVAVVPNNTKHVLFVALVALKRTQLARHFSRGRIGHTRHDRGQGSTHRTAFVAVIAKAHVHQQTADVRIAKAKRAEHVGQLRDFFGRELRHHHRNFERHSPKAGRVDILLNVKLCVLVELQQVHRREVTGRIVEEHIFRTGVRPTDCTILRASVPRVYGVVELDTRISTGPCRVSNLFPQIARFDGLGNGAVFAVDQVPIRIILNRLKEGIGHADRVVGVLTRHRRIGLGIPVGVIGREFDAGVALFCVVQNAFDIGFRDRDFLCLTNSGFQALVLGGIISISLCPIPRVNRLKDRIQLLFVHLRTRDDGRHFLFFDDLPVDEVFDIGVIGIDDHHLRCSTGCAA